MEVFHITYPDPWKFTDLCSLSQAISASAGAKDPEDPDPDIAPVAKGPLGKPLCSTMFHRFRPKHRELMGYS